MLTADGKSYAVKSSARDILDVLPYFADQHTLPHQDFPFPAGGIGFLSYEYAQRCDTIHFRERPDALGMPDAEFIFGHVFIVFDHYTDLLYVIGLNYREHEIDLARAVAETEARINDLNFNYLQTVRCPTPRSSSRRRVPPRPFSTAWRRCAMRSWRGTSCRECSHGGLPTAPSFPPSRPTGGFARQTHRHTSSTSISVPTSSLVLRRRSTSR